MKARASGPGNLAKGKQPLGPNQFKVVPQRKPNRFMTGAELLDKAGKKFAK